jgi:hypothetical protein
MSRIQVSVLRDGHPMHMHHMVLEFAGLIGTMFEPEYTDSDGIAEFEVDHGRSGVVYVDCSKEGRWSSSTATDITVSL